MKTRTFLCVLGVSILFVAEMVSTVRAGLITVDITAQTNTNLLTYMGGNNYPAGPTNISVAGVPFQLTTDQNQAGTLGIIQTAPGLTNTPGNTNSSYTIPANVAGAMTVYTLMNSAYGNPGATVGSIEFKGVNGSDVTFQLIEGVNIRDHYEFIHENSATNVVYDSFLNGVQNPSGTDNLDMQTFVLPSSFNTDTLSQIISTALMRAILKANHFSQLLQSPRCPSPAASLCLGSYLSEA